MFFNLGGERKILKSVSDIHVHVSKTFTIWDLTELIHETEMYCMQYVAV